jgi:hypothetical protein
MVKVTMQHSSELTSLLQIYPHCHMNPSHLRSPHPPGRLGIQTESLLRYPFSSLKKSKLEPCQHSLNSNALSSPWTDWKVKNNLTVTPSHPQVFTTWPKTQVAPLPQATYRFGWLHDFCGHQGWSRSSQKIQSLPKTEDSSKDTSV